MTSIEYIKERVTVTASGCWEWQRSRNQKTGYGQIGTYPYTAHKLAFYLANGRYPNGVTRHLCHNRACCNPEHLTEGSHADNYRDSELAHAAGARLRRGRAAKNRIPVTIDGVTYPSKVAAMRALRVAPATLDRLADR